MIYRNNTLQLDPAKVYVVLMRYGWKKKGIAKFTAPLVRLFTGKRFNHGALLICRNSKWVILESAEEGCVMHPAAESLDRRGSKIELREYIGRETAPSVFSFAILMVGSKYDYANLLLHQPIYRITRRWVGRTGLSSKGRVQCFEFIHWAFRLPAAWLASGAEFDQLPQFKKVVFTEL